MTQEPTERAQLEARVMACSWPDLVPHFARGALLMLSPGLDLIDVAVVIAGDDAAAVEGLLDSGALSKLSDAQAKGYQDRADSVRFQFLILQPYVLAQELIPPRDPMAN